MATLTKGSKDGDDHDLTICPICLEVYKIPKCLPCLHTFCLACLQTYISTLKQAKGGFDCPVCRTFVSTKSDVPEEMVSEIPTNHLIVSLMDKMEIHKDSKLCDSCDAQEKKTKADLWCNECWEALCRECGKYHKSMKALAGHKLVPFTDLKDLETFTTFRQECCEVHKDKKLEIFCFDHEVPCCLTCMTVNHRKCEKVTTIDEAAKGIKEKPETLELLEKFEKVASGCQKVATDRKGNLEVLVAEKAEIKKSVAESRKQFDIYLNDLESNFYQELDGAFKIQSNQIQEQLEEYENTMKIADNCRSILTNCIDSAPELQTLLEVTKLKRKNMQCEEQLKKNGMQVKEIHLEYKPHKILENVEFKKLISSFGEVAVKESVPVSIPKSLHGAIDFTTAFFQKRKSFSVIQTLNKTNSCITGGLYLSDGRLLLVDKYLQQLAFYSDTGVMISMINLTSRPWDAVATQEPEVAVTLPEIKSIQIVNVENLSLGRLISVNRKVMGISYIKESFVLSFPAEIVIVDSQGKLIQSILTDQAPNTDIQYVLSISCDKICYIAGKKKEALRCIDKKGQKIFECKNPSGTDVFAGIGSDTAGNIYVAGRDSKSVLQLDRDGKYIRSLLLDDNINMPQKVLFSNNKNLCCIIYDKEGKYASYGGTEVAIYDII